MTIVDVIPLMLAVFCALLGWRGKSRAGLVASLLIPAALTAVIAFKVPLPNHGGNGLGRLALFFVVLAVVSLASLGLGMGVRQLTRKSSVNKK
ncbi:MAG: hypothetical protein ABI222_11540 [Opitutaceae bacterium]